VGGGGGTTPPPLLPLPLHVMAGVLHWPGLCEPQIWVGFIQLLTVEPVLQTMWAVVPSACV
jgi:hypothetical protein